MAAVALACAPSPVRIDPPPPEAEGAAACARLHSALPDKLDGHPRREVEPDSPLVAAWGDPPIGLRCGVDVPDAYRPTSQLYTVNGVDWLPEELTRGYLFTTIGRTVGVELTVPSKHAPEINPLADLSLIVKDQVPLKGSTGSVSATPSTAPAPPR